MHVKIKITPQRVICVICLYFVWICFFGTTELSNSDLYSPSGLFSKYISAYESNSPQLELKLKHTQRVLITNNNDDNKQFIDMKYPPIPSLVGIGPEKCGTTSISYMLTRHPSGIPEIIKPLDEPTGIDCEMRVWLPCGNAELTKSLENVLKDGTPSKSENYCSLGWYQHFWSIHYDDVRYLQYYLDSNNNDNIKDVIYKNIRKNKTKGKNISNPLNWDWKYYYYYEKSPAYWCYEHVAFLFNKLLVKQGTKFFVVVRDPVKRTYSYWSHQRDLGHLGSSWSKYIESGLNNKYILNMIQLLKDETESILNIKDKLLNEWRDYVYDEKKAYGYTGARDGDHFDQPRSIRGRIRDRIRRKSIGRGNGSRYKRIQRKPWRQRNLSEFNDNGTNNASDNSTRRLLTPRSPGYVNADSNPGLGIGASCYIIPLLMWLKYVPSNQIVLLQSELMFGGNHDKFINDLRCWYALGYEYETMEECIKDEKKNAVVDEEHMVHSSKGTIYENDARHLTDTIFKYCNQRLKELLELDQYRHIVLHEMQWEGWYS